MSETLKGKNQSFMGTSSSILDHFQFWAHLKKNDNDLDDSASLMTSLQLFICQLCSGVRALPEVWLTVPVISEQLFFNSLNCFLTGCVTLLTKPPLSLPVSTAALLFVGSFSKDWIQWIGSTCWFLRVSSRSVLSSFPKFKSWADQFVPLIIAHSIP